MIKTIYTHEVIIKIIIYNKMLPLLCGLVTRVLFHPSVAAGLMLLLLLVGIIIIR